MNVSTQNESPTTFRIGNKELSAREVLNLEANLGKTFKTIAIFSLVNSALSFFEAGIVFPIGLAASQVVDGILYSLKQGITNSTQLFIVSGICLCINLMFSVVFYAFYRLSSVERRFVHIIGMLVYIADTGLCLLFNDYITAAFHGFFLFLLWGEFSSVPVIIRAKNHVEGHQGDGQLLGRDMESGEGSDRT